MKPPMKMPTKPPSNGKTSDPEVNSGGSMDGDEGSGQGQDRARRKNKLASMVAEGGKW